MKNQNDSPRRVPNLSHSAHCVSQMPVLLTKKIELTHCLVNLATGPGLSFMSQLDLVLGVSDGVGSPGCS